MNHTQITEQIDKMAEEAERELRVLPETSFWHRIEQKLGIRHTDPTDSDSLPQVSIGWKKGILLAGLLECGKSDVVADYLNHWIAQIYQPAEAGGRMMEALTVEDFLSMQCLMQILHGSKADTYRLMRETADHAAQYLEHHARDNMGSITYNEKAENGFIYADGIGMICPFLCAYAVWKKDKHYLQEAIVQIRNFYQNGFDQQSGLPWHCYDSRTGNQMGALGWARAAGWIAFGIAESIRILSESSQADAVFCSSCQPERELLCEYLEQLLTAAETVRLPDGLYPWKAGETKADTSGSAMIIYAAAVYIRYCTQQEKDDTIRQSYESLQKYICPDGRVLQAQGECIDAGVYAKSFSSYPWSVGMTLKLYSMMEKNQ